MVHGFVSVSHSLPSYLVVQWFESFVREKNVPATQLILATHFPLSLPELIPAQQHKHPSAMMFWSPPDAGCMPRSLSRLEPCPCHAAPTQAQPCSSAVVTALVGSRSVTEALEHCTSSQGCWCSHFQILHHPNVTQTESARTQGS